MTIDDNDNDICRGGKEAQDLPGHTDIRENP